MFCVGAGVGDETGVTCGPVVTGIVFPELLVFVVSISLVIVLAVVVVVTFIVVEVCRVEAAVVVLVYCVVEDGPATEFTTLFLCEKSTPITRVGIATKAKQ